MNVSPMKRLAGVAVAVAVVFTAPVPALAQDEVSEARVRKIEAEVRALQRKVFPGGDTRFFEPEINTQQTRQTPPQTPRRLLP